jgi:Mg-chelatase subunit ChlD
VVDVLRRMVPAAGATDRRGFDEWWRTTKATWAPPPWQAPPAAKGGGTVAGSVVQRAFDLRDAGLDVAIVIDSTGSMQGPIDAARDAIHDVVALLSGVAPKLRLGLVHYKDFGDIGDGAKLLVPMTKAQDEVRDKLDKLVASGGGDVPERVEAGVAVALSREMGWNKDANRLILVIGDAPPHPEAEEPLYELIRKAREQPFASGKGPVTGVAKDTVRPFITSAIATSPAPKAQFERIAAAGGGMCVVLEGVGGRGRPGARAGGDKGADQGGGKGGAAAPTTNRATQQLVEHIMLLSFGAQHQAQLRRFVRTFFEYRDAGMFE